MTKENMVTSLNSLIPISIYFSNPGRHASLLLHRPRVRGRSQDGVHQRRDVVLHLLRGEGGAKLTHAELCRQVVSLGLPQLSSS